MNIVTTSWILPFGPRVLKLEAGIYGVINSDFGNNYFGLHAVSAMNQDNILVGLPCGGTGIFWYKSCLTNVKLFTLQESSRWIVISFMSNAGLCFIFNVYMLCLHMFNEENELELLKCMSFIENMVNNELDDSGCDCTELIMGDFNATYEAINNEARLLALNDLLNDLHLVCCDDLDKTVGYTYTHGGLDQKSYIDHYYISAKKKCLVSCIDNIDSGGNLSDHNPIVMSVVFKPVVSGAQQSDCGDTYSLYNCKWNAVNCGFNELSRLKLLQMQEMTMPCMTEGNHGGCCDINHKDIIDSWCDNLAEVLLSAIEQSLADILYMNENVSTSKDMFLTAGLRELKQ